jgi:hypothetical protein
MKIPTSVVVLFAVALAFAPPLSQRSNADGPKYAASLLSPTLGQVLYPSQQVKVQGRPCCPTSIYRGVSWSCISRSMAAQRFRSA